MSYHLVT